jgi:hypothetical protein
MKTWKIITIAGFTLIAVALLTVSAFAYRGGQGFYNPYGTNTGTGVYGTYSGGMMGGGGMGGMMGGGWYSGNPQYGAQQTTPTNPYGMGGCHGGAGWNGNAPPATSGTAITIAQAVDVAKTYLASLNNPDLAIDEVEEYTQNFYVLFFEKSTGIGAFEMVIDKYTGSIYPEMGPNMMWNTKYGMMSGGMMGWLGGTPTATMPITVDQAKADAQQFLNANIAGTTVGDATTFYGYYHFDVLSAGNTYGMLSVNGYTGQVWYHNWHGTFIQEIEF